MTSTTWAKICGICHPDDIAVCVAAGADALGFVVDYPIVMPWQLTLDEAPELMALVPDGVQRVAVVGDDPEHVLRIARRLRPDIVQLHADESPDTTARLVRELHPLGVRVAKALRFDIDDGTLLTRHHTAGEPVEVARRYAGLGVDLVLVDSVSRTRPAGTGQTVDLSVATAVREGAGVPVILGGGLNAGNVGAAIEAVQPYGVDVISGVEQPRGRKHPTRVRDFLTAVRRAPRDVPAELHT